MSGPIGSLQARGPSEAVDSTVIPFGCLLADCGHVLIALGHKGVFKQSGAIGKLPQLPRLRCFYLPISDVSESVGEFLNFIS
jgi:hypothetical protein